jgi:hypothetical protein
MMGPGQYISAWRAAGLYTAPPHPKPFGLSRGIPVDLPPERNAVYIACIDMAVRYVGSTTRGVAARLTEHVKLRERAAWEELWVIGLQEELSQYQVNLAEERVGKLILPPENIRPPGR